MQKKQKTLNHFPSFFRSFLSMEIIRLSKSSNDLIEPHLHSTFCELYDRFKQVFQPALHGSRHLTMRKNDHVWRQTWGTHYLVWQSDTCSASLGTRSKTTPKSDRNKWTQACRYSVPYLGLGGQIHLVRMRLSLFIYKRWPDFWLCSATHEFPIVNLLPLLHITCY